jgi:hypothetical protein
MCDIMKIVYKCFSLSTFYDGKFKNLPFILVLMFFELISNSKRQRYTKFTYCLWVCGSLVEPTISYLNYQIVQIPSEMNVRAILYFQRQEL